jgi:drug/metabolite transporter (DMT)-like permease
MAASVVLLGLALAFCFGTSDYLSKGLTGMVGSYKTTVYTLGLSGLFVAVPSLLLGTKTLTYSSIAVLAAIALVTYAAFLMMYRGYQKGNIAVVSPTVNSFPIFSVVFAVFVLKVQISAEVLLALGGVIAGILLVSTNLSALTASRGRSLTPGVPEGLVAALLFAVGFTLLGYAVETIGFGLPVVAARLGAAAFGFAASVPLRQDVKPFGGKALRRVVAMGLLEAGGLMAFNLALISASSIGGLPIVTTLAGTGVVFTVGFAVVFLREKIEPNYAIGIVTLIASVAALLYLTA